MKTTDSLKACKFNGSWLVSHSTFNTVRLYQMHKSVSNVVRVPSSSSDPQTNYYEDEDLAGSTSRELMDYCTYIYQIADS